MSDLAAWLQSAVRWILGGFLLASIGGLANLNRLRPGDRMQQAALAWAVSVAVLVSARLVTLMTTTDAITVWSMRVQYAAILMQVPTALYLIGRPESASARRVATRATALIALLALAGPTIATEPVVRFEDALGHRIRYASAGPLALLMLPYAAGVGYYVARGALQLRGSAARGIRRSVVAVVLAVIPAGFNDLLMSLGIVHSFLLTDIASCVAVIGLSAVLIRRTHDAYDDLLAAYAAQREALSQGAAEVRTSERLAEHGKLVERVVADLQGPARRLGATLQSAEDALIPLFDENGGTDRAELADMLREAGGAAARIRSTVRALGEFAEASTPSITAVEIGAVIDRALAVAGNDLRHRARIDWRPGPRAWVSADPDRLTRAVVHALLSAARSIPAARSAGGRIIVSAETTEEAVHVRIEDNGIGIAEEELPLVFDPYAAPRSLDRSPSLGLAVCHRVVTALGGRVFVESSETGTRVTIELQRTNETRPRAA